MAIPAVVARPQSCGKRGKSRIIAADGSIASSSRGILPTPPCEAAASLASPLAIERLFDRSRVIIRRSFCSGVCILPTPSCGAASSPARPTVIKRPCDGSVGFLCQSFFQSGVGIMPTPSCEPASPAGPMAIKRRFDCSRGIICWSFFQSGAGILRTPSREAVPPARALGIKRRPAPFYSGPPKQARGRFRQSNPVLVSYRPTIGGVCLNGEISDSEAWAGPSFSWD